MCRESLNDEFLISSCFSLICTYVFGEKMKHLVTTVCACAHNYCNLNNIMIS